MLLLLLVLLLLLSLLLLLLPLLLLRSYAYNNQLGTTLRRVPSTTTLACGMAAV